MSTKNGSGTVLESRDVTYTDSNGRYINGNQTVDVFKRSSPNAGTPCVSATCTARYTYDARDRLTHQDSGAGGSSDYTLDPAGNITTEVSGGATTSYPYRGTQRHQEDWYSDALSDLDLGTDPLTSNRYSLAGGNPANFVEVDGHFTSAACWATLRTPSAMPSGTPRAMPEVQSVTRPALPASSSGTTRSL